MNRYALLIATGIFAASAFAADTAPEVPKRPEPPAHIKALIETHPNLIARISPYGNTCVEGEDCPVKVVKALEATVAGVTRSGDVIYEGACAQCHEAGLIGAPKHGDKGAWAPRIAKGKATLYNHAINGFNAMPARGGAEISDDEVKNAVDYMIKASS